MQKLITFFLAGLLVFLGWIIYLANTGGESVFFNLAQAVPQGDKIAHAFLYGLVALAANMLFRWKRFPLMGLNLYLGMTGVILFVVLEEISQIFFPTRTFDIKDLAADAIGIAFSSLLSHRLEKSARLKKLQER